MRLLTKSENKNFGQREQKNHIKLITINGVADPSKFENYVSSSLVDIAYVEDVVKDTVVVLIEPGIDLNNVEDRKWIAELITKGLRECGEMSANIIW